AVPLDDGTIALQQGVQEGGDDMLAGRDVPWAVDIPVTQDGARHPRLGAEDAHVMLAGDLGDPIRTDRVQGLGLRHGLPQGVAVDSPARGGEDDLSATGGDGGLHHVHGAEHIDGRVPERIRGRARHQCLRREMEDDARCEPLADPHHFLEIADVGLDEFGARVNVDARAGREVIDDTDLMTFGQQRVDQMRPDEARATGDQRAHQYAPCPDTTTNSVRARMVRSSRRDMRRTYSASSRIRSALLSSWRPLTCQSPVKPGRTESSNWPAAPHSGSSATVIMRGPTRLISPRTTSTSWGSSSRLSLRSKRPTRVIRGSPTILFDSPNWRCRASS